MTQIDRVPARAIQEVVNGREGEMLDALGIAWRDGNPHIWCPYPDHADEHPSWRWDECCRSIVDVVMRCGSINFEAAKIRVALMIDRPDLIKPHDGECHQAMDAASLLQPTTALRDDELARTYLSYRLGIPPGDVPMPITQVAAGRRCPLSIPRARAAASPSSSASIPAPSSKPGLRTADGMGIASICRPAVPARPSSGVICPTRTSGFGASASPASRPT